MDSSSSSSSSSSAPPAKSPPVTRGIDADVVADDDAGDDDVSASAVAVFPSAGALVVSVVVVEVAVVDDVSVAAEITVAPLMQFRIIACLLSRFPIRENFVKIQVRRLLLLAYCVPAAVVLVSEEEPLAGLRGVGASGAAVGEFPSFSSSELLELKKLYLLGFY